VTWYFARRRPRLRGLFDRVELFNESPTLAAFVEVSSGVFVD
jgi:hypothetical protein